MSNFMFDDYQDAAATTAIYPGAGTGSRDAIGYCTLKLNGEAGEVAEKVGKALYRGDPIPADQFRDGIKKELGGVLWYVARLASEFGFSLGDVAQANIDQLADRARRGVIKGSGDDR